MGAKQGVPPVKVGGREGMGVVPAAGVEPARARGPAWYYEKISFVSQHTKLTIRRNETTVCWDTRHPLPAKGGDDLAPAAKPMPCFNGSVLVEPHSPQRACPNPQVSLA